MLIAIQRPPVIVQSLKIPYSGDQFSKPHYRYSLRLRGGSSSSDNDSEEPLPDSQESDAASASEEDSKTRANPISSFFRSILDWNNVAAEVSDAPWDQGSDNELVDPPIPPLPNQRPSSLEHSSTGRSRGGALVHKPTTNSRNRLAHWLGPFDIGRVAPFADRLMKDDAAAVANAEQPDPTRQPNHAHGRGVSVDDDDDDEEEILADHDHNSTAAPTLAKAAVNTRRVWWHDLWTTTDDTDNDATTARDDKDSATANISLPLEKDESTMDTNDGSYQKVSIEEDNENEADDFDISDESDLDVVGADDFVDNMVQETASLGTNETRNMETSPTDGDPTLVVNVSPGLAAETAASPYISSGAVRTCPRVGCPLSLS
jgi:hypothetical protein